MQSMSKMFAKFGLGLLYLLTILLSGMAIAAPAGVESFDKNRWQTLQTQTRAPAIVVFSSVSCTHCPGVIAELARARRKAASATALWVVSIDSDDDPSLLADAHYAPADRLFSFRGHAQAVQYSVNPEWLGITPYVAFLDGQGGSSFVLGEPRPAQLRQWLRGRR
jgi:hypothetical protein